MRTLALGLFVAMVVGIFCASAFGQGEEAKEPYDVTPGGGLVAVGAGIGVGLIVIGAGLGISGIAAASVESIARQPEASGDIRGSMIITAALIEGVALFAAVICLLISFNIVKLV